MEAKLQGKKVAIVVANRYEDIELLYPVLRLSEEGAEILLAAVGEEVKGMLGHPVPIPVMAEAKRYRMVSIDDLSADGTACLMFPGRLQPGLATAARAHARTHA